MITDSEAFTQEFRRCAKMVGLGRWIFKMTFLPTLDEAWARIACAPYSTQAELEVGEDLFRESWQLQRQVILHELMHVVARDLVLYARSALDTLDVTLGERALVIEGIKQQEELMVDRLAQIIEKVTR